MHFDHDSNISPKDFCQLLSKKERSRLLLVAANKSLVYEKADLNQEQLKRVLLFKASSVSLTEILEKGKLKKDDQLKLLLSYLLAKAVWQFYDSEWMASKWSKDTIHFMREQPRGCHDQIITLVHKPYLATELQPPQHANDHKSPHEINSPLADRFSAVTHCYPKLLALGVMLMEIELGEGMEKHRPDNLNIENDDHYIAGGIILEPLWEKLDSYQAVKQMIEVCVKPDTGKLGLDNEAVRSNLYIYIVAPLGRLFRQAWHQAGDPESFTPQPICFTSDDFPADVFDASELSNLDMESTLDHPIQTVNEIDPHPNPLTILAPGVYEAGGILQVQ